MDSFKELALDFLRGARRSWTVWMNTIMLGLASMEAAGSHLTVLFGEKAGPTLVAISALLNILLRARTQVSLQEKGRQ